MTVFWECIKVLISFTIGVVFIGLGCLAVWLLLKGKVGHRTLLWLKIGFSFCFGISNLQIALNIYLKGFNFAVAGRGISALLGLALMIYAWNQRYNLCRTFVESERASEQEKAVESDLEADATMAYTFQKTAVDGMLAESKQLRSEQIAIERGG